MKASCPCGWIGDAIWHGGEKRFFYPMHGPLQTRCKNSRRWVPTKMLIESAKGVEAIPAKVDLAPAAAIPILKGSGDSQ